MDYNYAALTTDVTPEDIRAYNATIATPGSETASKVFGWVGVVMLGVIILATLGFTVNAIVAGGADAWVTPGIFIFISLVTVGTVFGVKAYAKIEGRRRVRLSRFALDNGLTYQPVVKEFSFAGMFFQVGHSARVTHSLTGTLPNGGTFQCADYSYTTGSGKNQQTHTMSFIRVQLERQMPHMVLDSVKNNLRAFGVSVSNLPISFQKDQRLTLEGNFNDYFHLYAPKEYESDALYVFTPDLMALFMDTIAVNDAEIVDNQLFVYSSRTIAYENPSSVQNIMKIVESVGGKTIRRTDRYTDEKAIVSEAGYVAEPARRLKRGGSVFAALFILAVIAYFIYTIVGM